MKRIMMISLMCLLIITGCESKLNNGNSNIIIGGINNESEENNMDELFGEGWTVESFLMSDLNDLSEAEITEVEVFLNKINGLEENYTEAVEEQLDELYSDFYTYLSSIGIEYEDSKEAVSDENYEDLQAWTTETFLESSMDKFTKNQLYDVQVYLDQINTIEEDYSDVKEDALNALYDDLYDYIDGLGIELEHGEDVMIGKGIDSGEGLALEPWTSELYLGVDYEKLTSSQIKDVEKILEKINELEAKSTDEQTDNIKILYIELNDTLRGFGLSAPIDSYETLMVEYPDAFTTSEASQLLALDELILNLYENEPDSVDIDKAYETLEALLEKAGFDPDNIIGQIESGSVNLATFNLDNTVVTFKGTKDISSADMKRFQFMIEKAKQIIAEDKLHYMKYFVINTDGYGNVLAYVSQENDELTKWRMVLDIKDAYDDEGNYLDGYDETLVHEYAHILTLNASQMQSESVDTYENEEGVLKKNSYLNQFYETFWTSIIDEHREDVDPMDTSGDSAYEFYEKHHELFVSDYAATNPEEDFAETFRIFVFNGIPIGNTIKDEKVLSFHNDPSLSQMRDTIRKNLGLN